ncbi:MAG: hypothetical protein R2777_07680 [Chitinophagales bacterium]
MKPKKKHKNAETLLPLINKENPTIGIEPSAILSFRDEYVRLVDDKNYKNSSVAKHSYTIEEFLAQEIKKRHY